MGFIGQLGMQAASGAVDAGMGLLLAGANDRRQLKQQGKLQAQEIAGQKQMVDYNMAKQLQMWKATSYSAQKEQMEQAGLNPGLMYGMGGGGGMTTGQATGNVTGGRAPEGGGEMAMIKGMGLDRMMQAAQIENLKADTEKKKAEATKTGGVDTELGFTQIGSLTQGITNAAIVEKILEFEKRIKGIDANIANQTSGDKMGNIRSIAEAAASTAEMIERDNMIGAETREDKIKQIKAEAIGAVLRNTLTRADTQLKGKQGEMIDSNIKINDEQIKKWVNEIMIAWDKLGNDRENQSHQQMEDYLKQSDFPKEAIPVIEEVMEGILKKRPINGRRN